MPRKKFKPPKPSPIVEAEIGSEYDLNDTTNEVLPAIKQLSSPDATERAWAASSVSNLVMGDKNICRLLLSNDLIRFLIERLTDSVYEVISEVLGTFEVCAEMYDKDILTPLIPLVSKVSIIIDNILRDIPPESDPIEGTRKTIWTFAENIIYIIWSLSEVSQKALKSINNANVVPFLVSFFMHSKKIPGKTVLAAAQCLHTITDENPDIHFHFEQNPQYMQVLLNGVKNEENISSELTETLLLIKVLYCGILSNLRSIYTFAGIDPVSEQNLYLLPVLTSRLTLDLDKLADEVVDVTSRIETTAYHSKDSLSNTEEERLDKVNSQLTTLQLALEILNKICSEGIFKDDDDDETNAKENLPREDNDVLMTDANNDDYPKYNMQELPTLNTMATVVLPELLRLANPAHLSFPEQLGSSGPTIVRNVTRLFATVHLRAIECLNNYLLIMADVVEGKWWFTQCRYEAQQTWIRLFELFNKVSSINTKAGMGEYMQETKDEILETLMGCLWTLSRGLDGDVPLAANQIQELIDYYKLNVSESMCVKIIGTLGVIARRQNAIEDNRRIGTFLFEIIQNQLQAHPASLDCTVESLNAIYDIYADKDFDYDRPVFVQGSFLQLMESMVDAVYSM
ncbi:7721_t:CDS:10, partial [Acaulospora morrowiae]